MSLKLSDLKSLHDAGFSLIYLHEREKRPLENGWTKGPRHTWKEIQSQFNPRLNVGVRLGESSHIADQGYLMCLDLDIKDPAFKQDALRRLKEVTGESTWPEVRSGSGNGSRHLYGVSREPFKMVTLEKHKDQWELCAYSTGRQMVLPPSIHPSGEPYVWKKPLSWEKNLPVFDPSQWADPVSLTPKEELSEGPPFEIAEVNLRASRIPDDVIRLLEDGVGSVDKSAELLSIAITLCRYGLTDNEILSVLSDPGNWMFCAAETRGRSRKSFIRWLRQYALKPARESTDVMRFFSHPPEHVKLTAKEAVVEEAKIKNDNKSVLPDLGKGGWPKSTLRNMVHILEQLMGGGLVGFNEFSARAFFLKDTPYGGKKGREIADHDDLALKHYVACHYRFEPSQTLCFEAHSFVARKYAHHPVRNYLSSLVWDKTPRLDTWLVKAFGALGPKDYVRAIGRKVLTAAVARVFEPGIKFDYVMVLEGDQGKGKSMSLGILSSRAWFTDGLGDIKNKDVVDQMTGKWIVELGELASIRGSENEHTKSFLSRQVDRVRMSYGRRSEDYPRQSVFIGSTNASEYFTDETGNRRYWPLKIEKADREWIRAHRDQLWAEAMMRYELGEDLYLSEELESVAREQQNKRFEVDEWEVEIKCIVKNSEASIFTTLELWRAINITNGNGQPSPYDMRRIGRIMHRLKFRRTTAKIKGVAGKCWRR
jgi:hypothetical protein